MIDSYRRMLDDPVRLQAFRSAIDAVVEPGDIVVDLGCALGTYAIFASRRGARRVYAVEQDPIIEVARRVAADNGCGDRIEFVAGVSTEVDPPERADVVIFEDFPTTLLSPGTVEVLRDIGERWLLPGGQILPARARQWVAAVEHAPSHHALDRFSQSGERVFGIDVSATRKGVFEEILSVHLPAGSLLTESCQAREVVMAEAGQAGFEFRADVTATRPGFVHGVALWFDLDLGSEWLSTGPLAASIAWSQVLLPLATPLAVEAGDTVELAVEAGPFGDDLVWKWSVASGDDSAGGSTFESQALRSATLARWDPDRVPTLGDELQIDHAVLGAVDGEKTQEEIAEVLLGRFPRRFVSADQAQRRVLEVLRRKQGSRDDPHHD